MCICVNTQLIISQNPIVFKIQAHQKAMKHLFTQMFTVIGLVNRENLPKELSLFGNGALWVLFKYKFDSIVFI